MNSHFVVSKQEEDDSGYLITYVQACYSTVGQAINYCKQNLQDIVEDYGFVDIYEINEWIGDEIVATWNGEGKKTWDKRYKV